MASDKNELLVAVISQPGVLNASAINWEIIATDLGIVNGRAAQQQWGRFRDKLMGGKKGKNGEAATPKLKAAGSRKPAAAKAKIPKKAEGPAAKKRKRNQEVEETEEDEGAEDEEGPSDMEEQATNGKRKAQTPPARAMPAGQGRAVKVVKEESEDDEEGEAGRSEVEGREPSTGGTSVMGGEEDKEGDGEEA